MFTGRVRVKGNAVGRVRLLPPYLVNELTLHFDYRICTTGNDHGLSGIASKTERQILPT